MNQKPLIIGITGGSGSGKSTFLKVLQESFGEDQLTVLSSDNYYKDKDQQQKDDQGIENYDLPTAIHRDEFERDVLKLMAGEDVSRQEYTFNNPNVVPKDLHFKATPIIILEGIFVFHFPEIAKLIDLKVYLYASESTALSRRIRRDKIERNYPLEDVLYRFEKHVLPTYRKYIEPVKDVADLVINNDHNFEPGLKVFKGYLNNYLASN